MTALNCTVVAAKGVLQHYTGAGLLALLLMVSMANATAGPTVEASPGVAAPAYEPLTMGTAIRKALTFEMMSSVTETLIFTGFYGSQTTGLGTLFAVSLLSSTAVYLTHEYTWDAYNQGTLADDDPLLIGAKAVSYRVLSTARSFVVGSVLGGANMATSAGFALTVAVADTALYVFNELLFAQPDAPPPMDQGIENPDSPVLPR